MRTAWCATIASRSASRSRGRATASRASNSTIARGSRSCRGSSPTPAWNSTRPTRPASRAKPTYQEARFRSRTTRPNRGTSSCGTRTSTSRPVWPTITVRRKPIWIAWVASPAWKSTRRRCDTSTHRWPTRSASTSKCSWTAPTSPTSTSTTTSYGRTSRVTRPSPNACSPSECAGSGDRCVGTVDVTRMTALRTIRAMAALVALAGTALAGAENAFAPTSVGGEAGTTTALAHWQIQSSAKAQQSGVEVSSAGYSTSGWYPVSGRATVMAGLLENGTYKDVFYGDNLRAAEEPDSSGNVFVIPWWYPPEFTVVEGGRGTRTLLRINGIIASADIWLNGNLVADQAAVAGAYPVHELDVTRWVRAGINTLALRVHPADPRSSLSIGWVDWNPTPPDNNMGPWRGVDIVRSGPVQIRFPQVTSTLSLPDLKRAALTVKVQARNLDASAHDATITGVVAGVSLRRTIHLDPGQTQTVSFSPKSDPGLDLNHPQVSWPVRMVAHPLYTAQMAAAVAAVVSDQASAAFGIRRVSSHLTPQGYHQFVINGKPVLIRGAGWAPDMFLRDDPKRMETEFSYVVNLGLNTIRSEGKLEDARFYDLADRDGIMILAGWECCDKWESWAKTGGEPWDTSDEKVAAASMASEARLLRNHPSVIGFLIGSDNAPPAAIAKMYVDTLHAEDWSLPIIAAAVDGATAETGPSGMKMAGPFSWTPPASWYAVKLGCPFGFDPEVSAGASIPLLDDLTRMLSPQELEALWKYPQARQFHASAAWSIFATIEPFDTALAKRYGPPKSLEAYVAKSQLDNYDNVRAQFEAFNAHMDATKPSTAVIYWMLNNAWPSLHWHLYDYFLNPAGAYFGAKIANEPVHIQYSYDTRAVMLVNHTLTNERGLQAMIRVRNLDGAVL